MSKIGLKIRWPSLDRRRFQRLTKEGGWILTGQIVSVLGALVLVRVLTEYLDPAAYGELALGLTIAGLVNQVVTGGVTAGIGRFYSIAAEKGDLSGYLQASRKLMGFAILAIGVIALALMSGLIWTNQTRWLSLTAAVLVFSVLTGLNSSLSGVQNAARQRSIVALHSGMDAWLKIGLAVGVMLWLGTSSTAVVIGYVLSALLVTASQLFFLRRLLQNRDRKHSNPGSEKWVRQMWMFSWPMMAGGLFNWGYYASQRWALELFATTEDVGKFYALTQIAYTPIILAGAMLMSLMVPILFARVGDPENNYRLINTHKVVSRIAVIGLLATAMMSVLIYFLHKTIFRIFVSPEYGDISCYMPLVVLSAGLLVVSHFFGVTVSAKNKTKLFLKRDIIGNLLIALINLYSTFKWGFQGLITSMLIGAVIHLSWQIIIVNSALKESS